jgi:hypothetical protein
MSEKDPTQGYQDLENQTLSTMLGEKLDSVEYGGLRFPSEVLRILLNPDGIDDVLTSFANRARNGREGAALEEIESFIAKESDCVTGYAEEFYRRIAVIAVEKYGVKIIPTGSEAVNG